MAHFVPSPWDPHFTLPANVKTEPPGRAVRVTKQLPRGAFGALPKESRQIWNRTKWATPDYAQGRYGQTPFTTKMLPRRTVPLLQPDALAAAGSTLDGTTIGGESTLGANAAAGSSDPILDYGKRGAAWIGREVMKLPKAKRQSELKSLFEAIEPGLSLELDKKVSFYKARGHAPKAALGRAMAATLSNNLAEDLIRIGKGQKPGPVSGCALGGWNPLSWVKSGAKLATRGVSQLGKLACGVVSSPAGLIAGGAVGGPAGAAGVQVASGMCPPGTQPIQPAPMPVVPSSFPVLPVVAALGGALILVVALK